MGLVGRVLTSSKAPGLADVLAESEPNVCASLIKRLIRIIGVKKDLVADVAHIVAPEQQKSAEMVSAQLNGVASGVEAEMTIDKLEFVLGEALLAIRRALWPSSELDSASQPIVAYSTGPLVMSMGEKPAIAKDMYMGKESKSSGKWSFEIGINGMSIPSEIGWIVCSDVDGGKKYVSALLNLKTGAFSCDGRSVQYLPRSLKIRGGDIITCQVDIEAMTFSYTLNGVKLPDLHAFRQNGDSHDNVISDPIVPGSAHTWPASRVLIQLAVSDNAKFYPSVSYSKQSPIHAMPSLSSSEYGSIFDLKAMNAHKLQCDLLMELLFEVLKHVPMPVKEQQQQKVMIKNGAIRSQHSLSQGEPLDPEQLSLLLKVLVGSTEVGLKAILPEEALRGGINEETPSLHHVSYVLRQSVLPFIIRLHALEGTTHGIRDRLIERWLNMLAETDDWSQSFLSDLLDTILNHLLDNPDTTILPLHSDMTIQFHPIRRHQTMGLLTRLLELPRLYYLAASSGLLTRILQQLFTPMAWDHQVRLEPYVAKESWYLFQKMNVTTALAEAILSVRNAQHSRLTAHAMLIYTLARHPPNPSQPKDPESRKNTNDFILALRSFISANPDMIRMKNSAFYQRAALNGLMFALLGAIEMANFRADRIFNNALHARILLDPSRAIVDRLGGTYSHVVSHYPNAFGGEPQVTNPEMPEIEFRDSQTSWPFELLDSSVFLYYYAFVPALTQTQTYSNDMEMANRTIENLNASKRRRGSDRPCADLDLAIEIQQQLSRVHTVNCLTATIEIFDEMKFKLLKKFADWMAQALIHTTLHPYRGSIIYYIPESYVHLLITIESSLRISKTNSPMARFISLSYPSDNTLVLPISEREDPRFLPNGSPSGDVTAQWYHSLPTCAVSILIQKNVILNPNLTSVILSYLCRVIGSVSLFEKDYIMGPKRFSQFMDVVFTTFIDNKNSHWTTILDGLVPFLANPVDDTCQLYAGYFSRWISEFQNRQKVDNFLNALFNFGSWTENEFDTHIDNYIEKLKNITQNVDQIVADPNRDPDMERPESRGGRQQAEERGFAKTGAKPEWVLNELVGGKVVVVLPVDDVSERLNQLKGMVPLQQGLDVSVREAPLYLFVLSQLIFVLASMAQINPIIFNTPLIMTRTCELVGHTLRRTLDQASSPPFVKFARLVGQSLSNHDTIIYQSPQQIPFYETNANQLIWSCTKLIVSLLRCSSTKALCLQSLAGLITNSAVDLYLTLEFTNIPEWHETQSTLQDLKHTTAREVLLRSGQEECPICYTNPVNTTFEPCGHRSCQSCIDRHLLNNSACFFCKAKINSTRRDGS